MLIHPKRTDQILASTLILAVSWNLIGQGVALAQHHRAPSEALIVQAESNRITNVYGRARAELPENFYTLYRIVERVIRANELDTPFWKVEVTSDDSADAFAFNPYILRFDRSIFDLMEGDVSALAYVVAHEMAHHTHRHMPELGEFLQEAQTEMLRRVTDVGDAQEMSRLGLEYDQRMTEFRHQQELEADRTAYQYVAQAGFDPQGCLRALTRTTELVGESEIFFHPAIAERIEVIQASMAQYPAETLATQGAVRFEATEPLTYELSEDGQDLIIRLRQTQYSTRIDELFGP
jgi:beta-barrel assembly-enhancing protease